ncbi:MAG: hypothetical protein AAF645_06000 [Myxococcota bacterium]
MGDALGRRRFAALLSNTALSRTVLSRTVLSKALASPALTSTALGATSLAGCGEGRPPTPAPSPSVASRSSTRIEVLLAAVHRGVCLAHSWEDGGRRGYGTETSARTLTELEDLGVDSISLTPFGFSPSLTSNEVRHVGQRSGGETDARMAAEFGAARARGLRVLLKPHLWVAGGAWRAELAPASWTAWFDAYARWMVRYARMAEEAGVAILAVGTELRSSLAFEQPWRTLIAQVRSVFSGKLVYCANWDALDAVPFWDALDYLGVQFYAPLASALGDSEAAMEARLGEHLAGLDRLSERVGRPMLLTEVGYKATQDTAIRPFEWTERAASPLDLNAQARAYRVLFRGLCRCRALRGVYLWKWFTNPDTREEGPRGFSPRGKPAEAILRAAYAPSTA